MTASNSASSRLIGYLAFAELAAHGVVGGYLLVNQLARPVAFHCNAPFRASRTQEILYGPTLRSFLVCDQIGQSLLKQSRQKPSLILTDSPIAMELRTTSEVPMLLLRDESNPSTETMNHLHPFHLDGFPVATHGEYASDQPLITTILRQVAQSWDFAEPIERIREAIDEAHQAAA